MIISSIDLMDGKVVQLQQGKKKLLERDDPLTLAKTFDRYGETAVIDLDAAMRKKTSVNTPIIYSLLKRTECRVGGGIDSIEKAKELISRGAKKIIIGSKAFEHDCINYSFLEPLSDAVGAFHIIIAVDALHGEILTRGWKHRTGLPLVHTIRDIEPYTSEVLFTCVEKEGTLTGFDMDMAKKVAASTTNKITVAGGVSTLDEIETLSRLGMDVQLGMALYRGIINLKEGFITALSWNKQGLLPTITQDTAGQVLMLAYSNRESLKKTLDTQKMWYYSRSRKGLWMKGETSHHVQDLIRIRADCDRDALLATVHQTGPACHTNQYSCFGHKKFSLQELHQVVTDRLEHPRKESYTSSLSEQRMKEKILEEAQEVVEAQEEEDIIWEAADVLYFLTVLLAKKNITIDDVLHELRRRRTK
jgi:phosphoribosyl-ATP pyrophosphohydrolase/phosphoribosyl-AMP cyclohydrolase